MNTKALLITGILLATSTIQTVKADKKSDVYQKSYNYQRGVELLMKEENESEAMKFFIKELEEHKDNGYAYYWISLINESNKRRGQALEDVNKAIKYLSKDAHWQSYAYRTRARVYLSLDDEKKALADMCRAIKLDPEESAAYRARGDYYYYKKQYDLADLDYRKMTEVAPGETYGYMALGRNAVAQERYDEAVEQYNYVVKLDPAYPSAYSFRAEAEMKQKKYAESLDDVIKSLDMEKDNDKAINLIGCLADSAYSLTSIKLKAQQKRNPNDGYWPLVLGMVNENTKRYQEAVNYYQIAFECEPNDIVAYNLAGCYGEMSNFPMALMYVNRAIELDSLYSHYQIYRVQIEEYGGMIDDALRDVESYINNFPEDYFGYHKRGWLKDKSGGNIDEAIEDYTTSAALRPNHAYNYLCRGQLYRIKGEEALAKADFEEVLKLDTLASEHGNARQYALFYLGDTIKAIEWMDKILNNEDYTDKDGANYDAACLYSLMGDTEKSLEYLKTAFELGWSRFTHARRDDDLSTVRALPEFEELIQKYENKQKTRISENGGGIEAYDEKEAEVPFAKDGGVFKVKCTINELPLYFVFDTGASDVSMSSVEANFMLKNDYLSKSDMSGKGYYIDANGDISEGTIVILREVNFGGLTLKNVKASIVKNQKAPLLLGQSVLSRLGKIEIDNDHKVIRVKYREKKETI